MNTAPHHNAAHPALLQQPSHLSTHVVPFLVIMSFIPIHLGSLSGGGKRRVSRWCQVRPPILCLISQFQFIQVQ